MANIGYELDLLGTNPKNKVTEKRTLTSKVLDGRTIMVPKAAPFHKFSTPASTTSTVSVVSGTKALILDVDYSLILLSPELTDAAGVEIYGGILFHNLPVNTVVDVTVQTIGGEWNLPVNSVVEQMAQVITNPRFATWSDITPTPTGLPTYTHNQDFSTAAGYDEYISTMDRLIRAVLSLNAGSGSGGNANEVLAALNAHINSTAAHKKTAIGLGFVDNFATAVNADFDAKPAANNKFVTPRMVHYAFTLWVGSDITGLKDSLTVIDKKFEKLDSDWTNLQTEFAEINTNLASIDTNYAAMVVSIKAYEAEVLDLKRSYDVVIENQKLWAETLEGFKVQMDGYSDEYNAVVAAQAALLASFAELKASYDELIALQIEQGKLIKAIIDDLALVIDATIYPKAFAITSGSRAFSVAPKEKFSITLVGGGGGVGVYVPGTPSFGAIMLGASGGDSSFRLLTNPTNGERAPVLNPIVLAEGGYGGNSSYGDAAGVATVHGIGGRGGKFEHDLTMIDLRSASNGEGGFIGTGNYDIKKPSVQDTGYDYFGGKWGKGALTAAAVGQGGEGAEVIFVFENKTNFILEAMVEVGTRGKSYGVNTSAATNGIAIVTKLKK